ncbi:hypothetical protein [Beijerinckia sp. L45]|uniref:hypothetical protein n=1 Tax=Beijerinckia sp. L45 TaxID=1641855 RepID=UPI00131BB6B2|nr:hypothetical protein [Beijerinckia sp. L45]
MTTIEDEARLLKAWIRDGHALSFASVEMIEEKSPDHSLFSSRFDEQAALRILRACQVNLVCVAPGRTEIRVGLEKGPSLQQTVALPSRTAQRHAITYKRIRKPVTALPVSSVAIDPKKALYAGRFYPCGSSISASDRRATGTLGCLVTKDDQLYGLTNNHVTGGYSLTVPEMPILAPGLIDVGPGNLDPFTIGHHSRCAPWTTGIPQNVSIKGNLDLAIFRIGNGDLVTSHQGNHFDTPTDVATLADIMSAPGAHVLKVGRTTGLTEGRIFGRTTGTIEVLMKDTHFKSPVHFDDTLIVESVDQRPFASPGDSGSLVVWKKQGRYQAVGIVFSTSPNSTITYLLPMEEVLKQLQVGMVGAHNVQQGKGTGGI